MEDFVEDFLERFAPASETPPPRPAFVGLGELDPEQYVWPVPGPTLEKRLQKLRRNAARVESLAAVASAATAPRVGTRVDYARALNPEQCLAATTVEGPLLVIAGAGTGKTRTLVYRVSYLLESGVPPQSILLLTFTRRAAYEMLQRATGLLGDTGASRVLGGTFHAFANGLLRRYAAQLGLPPAFTIIDSADAQDIIALIRAERRGPGRGRGTGVSFPRKERIRDLISATRSRRLELAELLDREYPQWKKHQEELELITRAYHAYKDRRGLLDYEDLLERVVRGLRETPSFLKAVRERYRYLLVDEYQDTNLTQREMVDQIAAEHRNLMVVGDDFQGIYSFRGANHDNILEFPESYPDCRVVKLERNYRSVQPVLDLANAVVSQAGLGYAKRLRSETGAGACPRLELFYDAQEEACFLVETVLECYEKGVSLKEMAVLYRAGYHGNHIQAELLRRGVPYVVVGGIKFIERRHVRDLVAFLRVVQNPQDAPAWHRILELLPGVGRVTARRILERLDSDGKLPRDGFKGSKKYLPELRELLQVLESVGADGLRVVERLDRAQDFYTPLLRRLEEDWELRLRDLEVLRSLAERYQEVERFLSDFALEPPSNRFQARDAPLLEDREESPLTLSTIHSAKGLEWRVVLVPHLVDGLFPAARSLPHLEDLEEERRLFYVAVTRAKEQLYLSAPMQTPYRELSLPLPSRFLAELDPQTWTSEGLGAQTRLEPPHP